MGSPVLAIIGPTASGKSALALALAQRLGGALVNFDSMQVYADLTILTARPTPAEAALAPHHLFGYLPVTVAGNAADWRQAALDVLGHLSSLPILVGGTGLYLRGLINGLSDVPEIDPEIRDKVRALAAEGDQAVQAALASADPVMATRLALDDGQRLARALEVIWSTGRSLADWQTAPPAGPAFDRPVLTILLDPPRDELAARIDARVWAMVEQGVLEEVERVQSLGLDPSLPAAKAHGLREFGRHLAGACSLAEAVARTQAVTRQYAKRQRTWARHQLKPELHLRAPATAQHLERMLVEILPFIDDFLLTTK